jgi:two-component system chemotaxis response regulator CheY
MGIADKRLLIVDDNGVSRSLLRLLLQEEGYVTIEEAGNGEQGLEIARRLMPDIVFLDIAMPRMGGLEVLPKLRQMLPGTVVIMVTSSADRATVQVAADSGVNGYILKPFTQKTVLQAISDADQGNPPKIRAVTSDSPAGSLLPIVVIEDDETLLNLYKIKMSGWPFAVRIDMAPNGYEGLLMLRDSVPALLICDLRMPKVNGLQILQALKKMEEYGQTRIVVVSGMPLEEVEARGSLPKGIEYLGKPIDFVRLEEIATDVWREWSGRNIR